MKESKILKITSYILIPILVAVMILSILSNYLKNNESIYQNEKEYFLTDDFVSRYMNILSNYANDLIYHNDEFPVCYDGETQISYVDDTYYYDRNIEIQDCYVLVRYKNKALTNVELTSETNTIEKILAYIAQNENSKQVNILGGNIESNSDIITNKGLKYFNYFENTYYTIDGNEVREDIDDIEMDETSSTRQYIDTKIQDFAIYSSYKEELIQNSNELLVRDFLQNYENLGNRVCWVVPVCLTILLIIAIYLIVSIGHSNGKEGIELNDLDKIPYEIILFVFFIVFGICIALLEASNSIQNNIDLFISMILGSYVTAYIACAVLFDTTVKRIKAKTLIKNTLMYKCFAWFVKIVKKAKNKMCSIWEQSTETMNLVKKLGLVIIGYIILSIILLAVFQGFGLLLDLGLGIFLFYKIAERIKCFKKMESHLKEMYEGNHTEKLESIDFTNEFQNTVKYINDISNGFENAIQERIKSERLKTELITNVSHDIKTPLTSIINYVDLLKKENIDNEKAKEYIEVLENKSQRLKKLTEDLIEASKASSGNVKLNLEKINVGELIKQSTGEFEDKFKTKKLEVITKIPDDEIYIYADNRYMYRIIENIFSNVAKYALENSRVYIDVVKKDKKVYIDVKNISKEILNISEEELMQRFVRGDKSRTTEGSGLGISISKSLAELQNGTLDIKIDGDLFKVELCFNIT